MKTTVYIADTCIFDDRELFERCIARCSENRKAKIAVYYYEKDKRLSALVYILLIMGFSKLLGINEDLKFGYGQYGKPYIENHTVGFSLSHSGSKGICAFSDSDTGADIESFTKTSKRVDSVLCDSEKILLENSSEESEKGFVRLWTCKEAYAKYTGRGLNENISTLDMSSADSDCCFYFMGKKIFTLDIGGYIMSVCSDDDKPDIIYINKDDITDFLNTSLRTKG